MNVRNFAKQKKLAKLNRRNSQQQQKHQEDLNQNLYLNSSEQKACRTLMQESWVDSSYSYLQKNEPDAFLQTAPETVGKGQLQLENESKKAQAIKVEIQKRSNKQLITNKGHNKNKTEKEELKNLKRTQISDNFYPQKSNTLIGKQVLCLTQYLAAGSNWQFNSVDNSRRNQRGRYIKILKQMKGRCLKNNGMDLLSKNGQLQQDNKFNEFFNFKKQQQFYNAKEQRYIERIRLNSLRQKKYDLNSSIRLSCPDRIHEALGSTNTNRFHFKDSKRSSSFVNKNSKKESFF